jgi:hypothetical protein
MTLAVKCAGEDAFTLFPVKSVSGPTVKDIRVGSSSMFHEVVLPACLCHQRHNPLTH